MLVVKLNWGDVMGLLVVGFGGGVPGVVEEEGKKGLEVAVPVLIRLNSIVRTLFFMSNTIGVASLIPNALSPTQTTKLHRRQHIVSTNVLQHIIVYEKQHG